MSKLDNIPLTETFAEANTVQTPDGQTMGGFDGSVAAAGKMFIDDFGGNIGKCMKVTLLDTDTPLFGGIRGEITSTADTNDGEFYYVWEQYIPEDFGTVGMMTTMQIHDTADAGADPVFPNVVYGVNGEEVVVFRASRYHH